MSLSLVSRSTRFTLLGLAAASIAAAAPSTAHLTRGQDLVSDIQTDQKLGTYASSGVFLNRYGGSWAGASGEASFFRTADPINNIRAANLTTCAPLVSHLLKSVYGWDWSSYSIPDPLAGGTASSASPKSYLYVSAIKNHVGFAQQLTKIDDVQPGDIAARWEVGTDDGHTMIVVSVDLASAKEYVNSNSYALAALKDTVLYEVTVLDSSASGHTVPAPAGTYKPATLPAAKVDTRYITYNGGTGLSGGAGIGIIGVLVNKTTHEIVAHTWSLPDNDYVAAKNAWTQGVNSRAKLQNAMELVFGRLPADLPVQPEQPGVNQL